MSLQFFPAALEEESDQPPQQCSDSGNRRDSVHTDVDVAAGIGFDLDADVDVDSLLAFVPPEESTVQSSSDTRRNSVDADVDAAAAADTTQKNVDLDVDFGFDIHGHKVDVHGNDVDVGFGLEVDDATLADGALDRVGEAASSLAFAAGAAAIQRQDGTVNSGRCKPLCSLSFTRARLPGTGISVGAVVGFLLALALLVAVFRACSLLSDDAGQLILAADVLIFAFVVVIALVICRVCVALGMRGLRALAMRSRSRLYFWLEDLDVPLALVAFAVLFLVLVTAATTRSFFIFLRAGEGTPERVGIALVVASVLHVMYGAAVAHWVHGVGRHQRWDRLRDALLREMVLRDLVNAGIHTPVAAHFFASSQNGSEPPLEDYLNALEWLRTTRELDRVAGADSRERIARHVNRQVRRICRRCDLPMTAEHVARVLDSENTRFIDAVMHMFDTPDVGVITAEGLHDGIVAAISERKNLRATVRDVRALERSLRRFVDILFWCVMTITTLAIAGIDLFTQLLPILGLLLASSFVFGETVRDALSAFILLFFVLPFGVGDRISLDGTTLLTVEQIGLMNTRARRIDGRVVYVPSRALVSAPLLYNYTRSPGAVLDIKVHIDAHAPASTVAKLRAHVDTFLRNHADTYNADASMFSLNELADSSRLTVGLWVCLRTIAWSDLYGMFDARTAVFDCVREFSDQHGDTVSFKPPPQRVILENVVR